VNTEAWNALDEGIQKIILEEAAAAEHRAWSAMQEQTDGHTKTLTENGMIVEEPSDALKAHFKQIGEVMTEKWVKENGDAGRAMYDAYKNR